MDFPVTQFLRIVNVLRLLSVFTISKLYRFFAFQKVLTATDFTDDFKKIQGMYITRA